MAMLMQQIKTGSSRDKEKGQNSGYILKVESRQFTDALDSMGVEGKDKTKNYFCI